MSNVILFFLFTAFCLAYLVGRLFVWIEAWPLDLAQEEAAVAAELGDFRLRGAENWLRAKLPSRERYMLSEGYRLIRFGPTRWNHLVCGALSVLFVITITSEYGGAVFAWQQSTLLPGESALLALIGAAEVFLFAAALFFAATSAAMLAGQRRQAHRLAAMLIEQGELPRFV